MTLLTETLSAISESGHAVAQVTFVGSQDGRYECTWQEFESLADADYDSGYGAPEVAPDLVIRFSDGKHLWRGEYDGSEWWEFDTPHEPYTGTTKRITNLFGGLWKNLEEIND